MNALPDGIVDAMAAGGLALALALWLAVVNRFAARFAWSAESPRKWMHAGLGLCCLPFPWLFGSWVGPALFAAVVAGVMAALRWRPAWRAGPGRAVFGVERADTSWGECWFIVAALGLFAATRGPDAENAGNAALYVVPLLTLSFGDAAAALVGLGYGRVRFRTLDGHKSVEGMAAFFFMSFVLAAAALAATTDLPGSRLVLLTALLAVAAALVEAVSWRGLDNLLVPLGAYMVLRTGLTASTGALAAALGGLLAGVLLCLAAARRSQLDGQALLAVALGAFVFALTGGWPWLAGPLVLFAAHLALSRNEAPDAGDSPGPARTYTMDAVLAVAAPGVFWMFAARLMPTVPALYGHAFALAVHLQIILLLRRRAACGGLPADMARVAAAGVAAGAAMYAPFFMACGWTGANALAALVGTAAGVAGGIWTGVETADFHGRARWREETWLAWAGSVAAVAVAWTLGMRS